MVHNIPRKEEDKVNDEYRNSSSERPPQGAYLFQTHLRGWSLIEMGAYFRGGGGYLNLANMMVSIFQKDLGYKVENLSKSWRSCIIEDLQYMNFIYLNCGMKKLRFG